MAMECHAGRLHVVPAAGIWEILRTRIGRVARPGEVGEIVATGLLNDSHAAHLDTVSATMRRGPNAELSRAITRTRSSRIAKGRVDDYMVAADGRDFGRLSTAMKQ
jgi:phenylacetate-coenzyme A ligase PaaK-like adenylate-forming protein